MPYKNIEDRRKCDKRRYKNNPNRRVYMSEYSQNRYQNHPEKYSAIHKIYKAILSGKISKPEECSICFNTENIVGHHINYYKPLSVVWLCAICHMKIHTIIKKRFQILV